MGVVGVEPADIGVTGVVGVTGDAGMGDMRPLRGIFLEAEEIICSMHAGSCALSGSSSLASSILMSGPARGLTQTQRLCRAKA